MITTHCLWIGGTLSTLERVALSSHVHAGHACRLWAYEPIGSLPEGIILEDAGAILPRSRIFTYRHGPGTGSVAAFANLFRYKLLYERGGWWCDMDVVCLKPFALAGDYVFASEKTPHSAQATNCVLKAPAGSPVLRYCLETAEAKDPAELNWGDTGPRLLGEAIGRFELDAFVVPPETFCPLHFHEAGAMFTRSLDVRPAHAVHLWHELWRRNGWDKDAAYPAECLVERLKRRFLGK